MKKLEAFLKLAIDCHNQIYFVLDAATDQFVYINDAVEDILGYPTKLLKSDGFIFEGMLLRPKRWKLTKKEALQFSEKGMSFKFVSEFKTSRDDSSLACHGDLRYYSFEGKEYIFGVVQPVDTQKEQNVQLQLSNLLNKNTNLLRERSFHKYIYSLIFNIQNLHQVDEILNFVCSKLVERQGNEFSVERIGLYLLKSDKLNRSYYASTLSDDVPLKLEDGIEEFLRNSEPSQEYRDGEGGVLIAINLFDVDAVDSVFMVKVHNEELLVNELAELKVILNSTARQVSNVYLTNRLRIESIEDPLTGAFNRRYFDKNIKDEVNRAGRHGRHLSLIFLDIDFFKKVNDVYGHSQGDQCLVEIVSLCSESGRSSDHIYRYGGEEFVMLLPETSYDQAMIRAEKIRELTQHFNFTNLAEPDKPLKITVSLGVTEYKEGLAIKDFINSADDSLYQAKSNGRNRVVGSK